MNEKIKESLSHIRLVLTQKSNPPNISMMILGINGMNAPL
jgi:hypothetical protein